MRSTLPFPALTYEQQQQQKVPDLCIRQTSYSRLGPRNLRDLMYSIMREIKAAKLEKYENIRRAWRDLC